MRGGKENNDEVAADIEAFGLPAEALQHIEASTPESDFEVLPENWPVVDLFMRVQTQWKFSGFGTMTGLDYNGVDVVMRRAGIQDPDGSIFTGLQVMEVAALNAAKD